MGRINRLDEHLSNMIAAGEVVERPSGIVKELVENSIDASAKHVDIYIKQGGIESIQIIDDGIGMDSQDAVLAFERHATSKIKETDDLWNIRTMGFRGEALPSIASVAHTILKTNDGKDGTEVEIRFGKLIKAQPVGTPRGTSIEVRNLFQKTPARFKHLKTPQYEFSLISDVVQKFAVSHPQVAFSLTHDGRAVFKTNGGGNLKEVLMQIYGREAAKSAISVNQGDGDFIVTGYAVQPMFHRATKYYMLLFVNERMVRSYHLQKAIQDAYAPYMPKDRYPIVVLDIKMDPHLVDVNVHPSKWEIRLSKEKQLEKLIYTALHHALKKDIAVNEVTKVRQENHRAPQKVEMPKMTFTYENDREVMKLHTDVDESFMKISDEAEADLERSKSAKEGFQKPMPQPVYEDRSVHEPEVDYPIDAVNTMKKSAILLDETKKQSNPLQSEGVGNMSDQSDTLPHMEVIGQLHGCYILAQGEDGLYIIDQHAAQERYNFERLSNMLYAGNKDMQPLLIPITVETSSAVVARIDQIHKALEEIGIDIEAFGANTVVCRQLPVWMSGIDETGFLQDLLDIWNKDEEIDIQKLRENAVATMACHSSIRFNRILTLDEMNKVIEDLHRCNQPYHCPHGRPTFIKMTTKQLEKEFLRIV